MEKCERKSESELRKLKFPPRTGLLHKARFLDFQLKVRAAKGLVRLIESLDFKEDIVLRAFVINN